MGGEEASFEGLLGHAERLAALLFVHELTPPHGDEAALLWLLGRAAEVERYVESVVDDRAAGLIDAASARASLATYVESLHVGLATLVGETRPSCCDTTPRRRRWRRP